MKISNKILKEPRRRKRRAKITAYKAKINHNPIKHRTFVCLGRLNDENHGTPHAWVMTINRSFDTITFWETLKPVKYELKGRIEHSEASWLRNYLSPEITQKDRKKYNKEKAKQKKKKKDEQKQKKKEKQEKEKEKTRAKSAPKAGSKNNKDKPNNKGKTTCKLRLE